MSNSYQDSIKRTEAEEASAFNDFHSALDQLIAGFTKAGEVITNGAGISSRSSYQLSVLINIFGESGIKLGLIEKGGVDVVGMGDD